MRTVYWHMPPGGMAFSLENNAAIKVQVTVCAVARACFFNGHVTGKPTIKIFIDGIANTAGDKRSKAITQLHVLSRYAKAHGATPFQI